MQRTVGRHIRGLDEDTLTHLDRVLLPILQRLARERPVAAGPILLEGWFGRFKPRARLTRGLKTEAGARHFVGLMARGMA